MNIAHLPGFAAIAGRYRGFIIDLWGVIHDGVTPYDGAVECLQRLRAAGAPVALLSNAPRRAAAAAAGLRRMGIDDTLYRGIVTSGEVTWQALADHAGARIYHLGPERDRNVLEGRAVTRVATPAAADLVLNTGPDDLRSPTDIAEYEDELTACLAARLPMICANPDLEIIRAGQRLICAGALALWYEARGGAVRWIGKPYPEVYAPVLALLGLPLDEVLAVGDALRTDIAGAQQAGIDSCWVLGGIHAMEDPAAAAAEAKAAGLTPVASLAGFRW